MNNYDLYISTNPLEDDQDKFDDEFDSWLSTLDTSEGVAKYLKGMTASDIICFASQMEILLDDEDVLTESLKDCYKDELEEAFRNCIWEG